MRSTAALAAIGTALLTACDSPPAQNTPPESNLVDATATDQAYPSTADGNQIISGSGVVNAPGASVPGGGTPAGSGVTTTGGQQGADSPAGEGAQPANEQGSSE